MELFRDAVERDEHRGAVLLVARHGKTVLHEAVGWSDADEQRPMRTDGLFRMASNTKPVIATAVLMLAEEEKLALDDNVREHLGSFDNYRSGWIQIRHLLSHTGGLRIGPIFLEPMEADTNLRKEAAKFGRIGAERFPGTSFSYSNPGYNTLGALIEVVAEQPLEKFLAERIYEPLGMTDSLNDESRAEAERMSSVYTREEDGSWTVEWKPGDEPDYPIVRASGGMISTAADYARFCQMWLNGGELEGQRLLSEDSIRAAWTPAPNSGHGDSGDQRHYGYGWFQYADGGWGHSGSDGTYAWIHPADELIVLVFGQSRGAGRLKLPRQFTRIVRGAARPLRE